MSNYNDYLELHELYHHGIKGQKWGVRRFQNEDGSLTEAGKKKVYKNNDKIAKTALGVAGAAGGAVGGIFLGKHLSKLAINKAIASGSTKEAALKLGRKRWARVATGMAIAGLFTGLAVNKLREKFNKYRRKNAALNTPQAEQPKEGNK